MNLIHIEYLWGFSFPMLSLETPIFLPPQNYATANFADMLVTPNFATLLKVSSQKSWDYQNDKSELFFKN
jgi:hypothetical protein